MMTHVIGLPCVDTRDRSPIDEGVWMLHLQPDEAVDRGAREPVCPVGAIIDEDEVPHEWAALTRINAEVRSPGGSYAVGTGGRDHPDLDTLRPHAETTR